MGTRHVRLDEDVYERIEARKHEDETFSEAIDRLTSDWSLSEFSLGFDEDGDVWDAEYTDLYEQYVPLLGKATCQQLVRKNSEAWRSHF